MKSIRNREGFCLEKARGIVWVWVKSWKCRRRGKVCVIKGLSHECGYFKSPEPIATNVLPAEADNLSEVAVGLATRCKGYGICCNGASLKQVRTPLKLVESWHFVLFHVEADYVSIVADIGFLHVSSLASMT